VCVCACVCVCVHCVAGMLICANFDEMSKNSGVCMNMWCVGVGVSAFVRVYIASSACCCAPSMMRFVVVYVCMWCVYFFV